MTHPPVTAGPVRRTPSRTDCVVEPILLEELAGRDRSAWDALYAAQDGVANPFCAPEWVQTWYEHFTHPADRHLLLVRKTGRLVGVAPFYVERRTVSGRSVVSRLRLAGAGQGGSLLELPQILASPAETRAVTRAVVAATMVRSPGGRRIDWSETTIPTSQGWFEPEWSYSTGEPVSFFRPQWARACVVLPLAEDWEATRSSLKRNLKESLRRSRNRIAKDGRAVDLVPRTADLDHDAVDTLLRLHRMRSVHDAGTSHADAYADPRMRAFLRDVLPRLGQAGRATLLELHLGGAVAASQLALHAPGLTYFHSSGVDPEEWSLGPVTYLQEHLVREAVARGDRWVNFSPGPNVAKLRWSEQVDVHYDFAYGSGGKALRWKYAAFSATQALGQVNHAISMASANAAPARVDGRTEGTT